MNEQNSVEQLLSTMHIEDDGSILNIAKRTAGPDIEYLAIYNVAPYELHPIDENRYNELMEFMNPEPEKSVPDIELYTAKRNNVKE